MQASAHLSLKKQYPGLDLLKFIMALMVVAIHVKPFETNAVLAAAFKPCLDAAVPVFFFISAFLLFLKIDRNRDNGGEKSMGAVLRFVKRIGVLYLAWFIIDSPYIIINKGYFRTMSIIETIVYFMKDVLLSSTFPGSWFLSALVVSVVLVYGLSRVVGKWPVFVFALFVSIYVQGQDLFPESWRGVYDWYAENIRRDVVCSFPFALVWVSMGQVIASLKIKCDCEKGLTVPPILLWCGLGVVYVVMIITSSSFFVKYLFVSLLFGAFLSLKLKDDPIYKRMRNASILVFFFHFSIAGKKILFLDLLGVYGTAYHILYYFLVIVLSLLFAFTVLWLEKNKYFHILKYTH